MKKKIKGWIVVGSHDDLFYNGYQKVFMSKKKAEQSMEAEGMPYFTKLCKSFYEVKPVTIEI